MGARHSNANSEEQRVILSAMEGFRLVSDKVQAQLISSIDLLNQYELDYAEGFGTVRGQKLLSEIEGKLPESSPLMLSYETFVHDNTQKEYKVYSLVLKRLAQAQALRDQQAEARHKHEQVLLQELYELEAEALREQQEYEQTLLQDLIELQAQQYEEQQQELLMQALREQQQAQALREQQQAQALLEQQQAQALLEQQQAQALRKQPNKQSKHVWVCVVMYGTVVPMAYLTH